MLTDFHKSFNRKSSSIVIAEGAPRVQRFATLPCEILMPKPGENRK